MYISFICSSTAETMHGCVEVNKLLKPPDLMGVKSNTRLLAAEAFYCPDKVALVLKLM